jgi:heterodisulfide reductase subunit B
MKQYAYFPGCSLEKIALSYHQSSVESAKSLGVELKELEDWNCCGATTYFHVDQLLAYALVARNLAMAEKEGMDLVAPCSACFKNAFFTNQYMKEDPELADHINFALEEDDLHFSGDIDVHHLIDVFVNDIGVKEVKKKVTKPLDGLKVAAYYGCQIVRPRKNGENVEDPQFFEDLMKAIGAKPVDFPSRLRCCGGSLIMTSREPALDMVQKILQDAVDNQADVIATACPLCQINVECYQSQVNEEFGKDYSVPVVYFTQLLGLALGTPPKKLGFGKEFVKVMPFLSNYMAKEAK